MLFTEMYQLIKPPVLLSTMQVVFLHYYFHFMQMTQIKDVIEKKQM